MAKHSFIKPLNEGEKTKQVGAKLDASLVDEFNKVAEQLKSYQLSLTATDVIKNAFEEAVEVAKKHIVKLEAEKANNVSKTDDNV